MIVLQGVQEEEEEPRQSVLTHPHQMTRGPRVAESPVGICQASGVTRGVSHTLTLPSPAGDTKSNTLSLVVTGLRLLLAKAVAVNVLMTIKAFLV